MRPLVSYRGRWPLSGFNNEILTHTQHATRTRFTFSLQTPPKKEHAHYRALGIIIHLHLNAFTTPISRVNYPNLRGEVDSALPLCICLYKFTAMGIWFVCSAVRFIPTLYAHLNHPLPHPLFVPLSWYKTLFAASPSIPGRFRHYAGRGACSAYQSMAPSWPQSSPHPLTSTTPTPQLCIEHYSAAPISPTDDKKCRKFLLCSLRF